MTRKRKYKPAMPRNPKARPTGVLHLRGLYVDLEDPEGGVTYTLWYRGLDLTGGRLPRAAGRTCGR
jgi:hypothetical protein